MRKNHRGLRLVIAAMLVIVLTMQAGVGVASARSNIQVGDVIIFGSYEQDGNLRNGTEPITWIVLEKQHDCILVISEKALDSQRYHYRSESVDWSRSSIRTWLNSVFYNAAFTYSEQRQICDVRVDGNWEYDRLYLLSLNEVNTYFSGNNSRIAHATTYAVQQNAYVNQSTGGSWWLLRTPGTETSTYVMSINSDGTIDYDGGRVESDRGTVRPVMWISLS